ncbi:MAG: hypothetical protein JWR52_2153 [Marmoricola sp.]|nr:hypothetical protein [Marmoricola sp.]
MASSRRLTPFSFRRLRRVDPVISESRPLVLIHGMSSGPSAWDPVLPLLLESRRVHVVTLPGHRGGRPLIDPSSLRSIDYVDALEEELDLLGIAQADLVGNSLGGWAALQLAGRGRALSVVCLAPAGGWAPGKAFDRFLAAQFAAAYRACVRLTSPGRHRFLGHPSMRRALLAGTVARPEQVTDAAYLSMIEDIAGCEALRHSIHRPVARDVSWVPRLDCPVLIAWSDNDRVLLSRAAGRRLEKQIGAPEVVRLPGVGHVPMSDSPELVASTILEFIARTRPARQSGESA